MVGVTEYGQLMSTAIRDLTRDSVTHIAFGDLFLEELRASREEKMRGTGIELLFPLWKRDTCSLAREMIEGGLRARISSVSLNKLTGEFLGREFDRSFLKDLPRDVDPCGELGEFHSFVYDGPMFENPIPIESGAVTETHGNLQLDIRARS